MTVQTFNAAQGYHFATPTWETMYLLGYIPASLHIEDDHYEYFVGKSQELGLEPAAHVERRNPKTMNFRSMNCIISEQLFNLIK